MHVAMLMLIRIKVIGLEWISKLQAHTSRIQKWLILLSLQVKVNLITIDLVLS